MHFDEYTRQAVRTIPKELNFEQRLSNSVMGLLGELGEVADVIKKASFQGHPLDVKHIEEELGDVMWYVAMLSDTLKISVDAALESNIQKLKERYPDGFDANKSVNREK